MNGNPANPQYGNWVYYPSVGYYARNCNYYDHGLPNHFLIIYHPSYPQYFYCYYPLSATTGYYWCRCYTPNVPEYSPFLFAVILNAKELMCQTIEAANQNFQPFYPQTSSPNPATYPPSNTQVMDALPPGYPQG